MITKNARKFQAYIGGKSLRMKSATLESSYEGNLALLFEDYGSPHGGMYFGNIYVPAECIKEDVHGNKYFITYKKDNITLYGQLEIVGNKGYGHITLNGEDYMLKISPWATHFNTKIAAGLNIKYNEEEGKFSFDSKGKDWQNADWRTEQLDFAYAVYDEKSSVMTIKVIETSFQDKLEKNNPFEINSKKGKLIMSSDNVFIMEFKKEQIPAVPEKRKGDVIHSVYPVRAEFHFDFLGAGFEGVYQDAEGNCYGIIGEVELKEKQKIGTLETVKSIEPFLFSVHNTESNLNIYGLAAMNPVVSKDGEYYDKPGMEAMEDYHKIIINYMDEDLRKKYYGKVAPILDDTVRHIAMGNDEAEKYYKSIQIPFLASSLADYKSTESDYARKINRIRAVNEMKKMTDDPIYKKHSNALYRYHFETMYPDIKLYLEDQKKNQHGQDIKNGIDDLKDMYGDRYENSTGETKENLNQLLKQLETLNEYAQKNHLYWAFMLYYYLLKVYMPMLEIKMLSGYLAQAASEEIKNYVALFEILESDISNGSNVTFASAFMNVVKLAQLTVILPQKAKYKNFYDDYVESYEVIFQTFIDKYGENGDEEIKEQVEIMNKMLQDQLAAKKCMRLLRQALDASSDGATWEMIITNFKTLCEKSTELAKLGNIVSAIGISFAFFIIVEFLNQKISWQSLTTEQKTTIIISGSGMLVGLVYFIGRNVTRLKYAWSEISGLGETVSVLFGGKKTIEIVDRAIGRLNSSAADFFLGSNKAASAIVANKESKLILRLFGGNVSRAFISTVGAVLAIVTIVTCSIELGKGGTDLEIWMNSLGIAASSLQLIALAGNFCMVGIEGAAAVLSTFFTCIGVLSVLAVAAGLILAIIYMGKEIKAVDPLQDFYDNTLEGTELRMPQECALEYISTSADRGDKEYSGYAIGAGDYKLKVDSEGKLSAAELDYSSNMLWIIQAGVNGKVMIYTIVYSKKEESLKTMYLCVDKDYKLKAAPLPSLPEKEEDGTYSKEKIKEYKEKMERYYFAGECTNVRHRVEELVYQADFSIYYQDKDNSKYYINVVKDVVELSKNNPSKLKLDHHPLGRTELDYYISPFTLYQGEKEQYTEVFFTGMPLNNATWNIIGDLENQFSYLEFKVNENKNGCTIRQKENAIIDDKTSGGKVKVTASVKIDDKQYSSECDINIEIKGRNDDDDK